MSIELELSEKLISEIKKFADMHKISTEDFIRRAISEALENEYDKQCYKQARVDFEKDPTTYTHEETVKLLHLE